MPLRCLLFSSNEEIVQPIWQVLTDLGIEGEYCQSAVDAVERVTTQLFQIVIMDWEDQPEAAFLLKTARDLKAAHRPLILAIVGEDAKLPEALQAGANSVLVKPIRTEQVRDTMSTACELLQSKLQPSIKLTAPVVTERVETSAMAAAAAAGSVPAAGSATSTLPSSVPQSVTQAPEKTFRAGEFLTSAGVAPGAEFDTEKECDVQKSLDQAAVAEIDALTDLEPMASAVEDAAPVEPAETQTALTGWASLQARLTKPMMRTPVEDAPLPAKSELLSYGETPSHGAPVAELPAQEKDSVKLGPVESVPEVAALSYAPEEPDESAEPAEQSSSKRGKVVLSALAIACLVLAVVPRTRQSLRIVYHNAVHAGGNWLNPPPAPLPQAVALHDSFGQEGDEYKLPATANIPDATTDPSQIRVLPVIDPTAKAEKTPEANGAAAQTTGESNPSGQNQAGQNPLDQTSPGQSQTIPSQAIPSQANQNPAAGGQAAIQSAQAQADPVKNSTPASVLRDVPVQATPPTAQAEAPQPHLTTSTAQKVPPPRVVSTPSNAGIPSSLRSQMASSTPDASGNKPPEAAMSAIEPVGLPEPAARELLSQAVDPEYPAAAKAGGQRGSVVLQVTIGRDGAVQDVKFLEGSLMFARSAIDAVRQWHFKPYSMNGRAVSVQTLITLNFKPPA
jgi:TonB family protein